MEGVANRTTVAAQNELNRAADEAASQIHGMQFGILTSSIVSMMIYDVMNASEIRRSTEKAQEYLETQRNRIMIQKDVAENQASSKYIRETLKPSLESGLVEFFSALLGQYMKALSINKQINLDCIRGIDEVKSSRMIDNIHLASDKLDLLGKATALCPYNTQVYTAAYKYGVLNKELGNIVQSLNCTGLSKRILVGIRNASGITSDDRFNKVDSQIYVLFEKYKYSFNSMSYITGNTEKNIFGGYVNELLDLKAEAIQKYIAALKNRDINTVLTIVNDKITNVALAQRESILKDHLSSCLTEQDYDCVIRQTDLDIAKKISQATGIKINSYNDLRQYTFQLIDSMKSAIYTELDNRIQAEKEEAERLESKRQKEQEEQKAKALRKRRIQLIGGLLILIFALSFIYQTFILKPKKQNKDELYSLQTANVGDQITFGHFADTNEWIVLDKKEDQLLLISSRCVQESTFNSSEGSTSWAQCSLRTWLNHDYISQAFNDFEQDIIMPQIHSNNRGGETKDRIFLLSQVEAKRYFSSDKDRIACRAGTENTLHSTWWLRTSAPEANWEHCVMTVDNDGTINSGAAANMHQYGVRPAMWLSIQ